jgi:hypothetical protein
MSILVIRSFHISYILFMPYKDIETIRGGKFKKLRIWTNLHKWKYKTSNIYIKQTYILLELLQHIPKLAFLT